MRRFLSLVVGIGLLLGFVSPVSAYYTNMSANVVVGQQDFISGSANQGGSRTIRTLATPYGVTIYNSKLIVGDYSNNRVLIYDQIPTQNNAAASVVVGQSDFTSASIPTPPNNWNLRNPANPFIYGSKLIVADSNNQRILIWNFVPTVNGAAADIVIGQAGFTTRTTGTTSTEFNFPIAAIVDPISGKMFVADYNNNRVLIYNQVPTSNGASADAVLGQTNLTSGSANQGGSPTASTLKNPQCLLITNGKLIVCDRVNNRVLIWNSIPSSNATPADVVIGQVNFTGNNANQGGSVGPNTLNNPVGATSDGVRLFVTDSTNNRVLIFNSIPTSNNASADIVIGQPDFTSNTANNGGRSGSTLNDPIEPFVFNNQLFIPDESNNRLLIFENVISTPELTLNGVEKLKDNRMKISGNIKLGEAGRYDLGGGGGVSFSINGSDGVGVNSVGNEVSDGAGSKFWEFSNTFEPWTGGNGTRQEWEKSFESMRSSLGFSVKVTSKSSNTDSSKLFFFEPFKLVSFTPTTLKFSVVGNNPWYTSRIKDQLQRVKDNIDHFEVWIRKTPTVPYSISSTNTWIKYIDKISTEKINTKGEVNLSSLTPLFKLNQSNYQVKVVSISKESNLPQDSNTLNYTPRRIVPRTPTPTVQAIQTETTPQPSPSATARQATPTPTPQNKSCFLWWCW